MGLVYSNYLKVLFVVGNVLDENRKWTQEGMLTVQKFDYAFSRTCNSNGIPFGATTNPIVEFTLKFMAENKVKSLVDDIMSRSEDEFSFLFNAQFDQQRKLENFENAVVVRGYVVDMEQMFAATESNNENQPMELKVKVLASDLTYAGSQSNKTLFIYKR